MEGGWSFEGGRIRGEWKIIILERRLRGMVTEVRKLEKKGVLEVKKEEF